MRSITEIHGQRRHRENNPPLIKRTIEIPWIGVAEIGIRDKRLQKKTERAFFPDNLMNMLGEGRVRFHELEGHPRLVGEDSFIIRSMVPYIVCNKDFGIGIHAKFTVTIGETRKMPVMIGQVDQGCGACEIKLGKESPVPPRQPLEVDIDFENHTNLVLTKNLYEMIKDTDARFVLGIRLIGVQRMEIRKDSWV